MKLFCLLLFLLTSIAHGVDICVLTFERNHSVIARTVQKVLKKYPDVTSIIEAKPRDILKCNEDGARRIILIAHSAPVGEMRRLVYFRQLEGEERDNYIQHALHESVPATTELYDQPRQILPNIFRLLREQKNSRLEEIVIAACDHKAVLDSYQELQALDQEGTRVTFAKDSWFWSLLEGHSVSNFNPNWLKQQLNKPL